ncbi:MAG: hypothetical protein OXL68_19265 [Paracoccaceae bacterium]|nr:hypothetical protein [Paracoccaceae bacterium]
MRKIDPEGVWNDFSDQLDEQSHYYRRSWNTLTNAADRRIATENYALAIGVMFEGYVNDLIFAYSNRDCSRVMQHLKDSVQGAVSTIPKAKAAFEKFADFKLRRHLNKTELKEILDPEGRNISFPNFAAIEDRARQWLADDHCGKFGGLIAQQKAVIDAVIATRNNLAHRSKGSLDRLYTAFSNGALHGTGLQLNVNRIKQAGYYFKAKHPPNGADARATILGRGLKGAAEVLVH